MITALLLATLASTGLHLEESDVPLETALRVMGGVSRALEAAAGERVVLDDPSWSTCDAADRCLADIRARTGADEVVLVRVFAGPSLYHVVLERAPAPPDPKLAEPRLADPKLVAQGARSSTLGEADLPKGAASWDEPLAAAARALYPGGPAVRTAKALAEDGALASPAAARSTRTAAPWIVAGAGVGAGIAGAIFGVLANTSRSELEAGVLLDGRYDELSGRLHDRALAADVLFGVAAAALVTSVVWWAVE